MPNLGALTPLKSRTDEDEELITFLNSPMETPTRIQSIEPVRAGATPLSICVEPPTDNTDSISEISIRSGQISPVLSHTSVDLPVGDCVNEDKDIDLKTQNLILRNEVKTLSNELDIIMHKAQTSENGEMRFLQLLD